MDFKKETFIYLQLYMRHRQLLYVVQRQCLHVRQSCRVRPLSPLSCVKCAGLTSFQLELQMIMKQHYEWEKYICFSLCRIYLFIQDVGYVRSMRWLMIMLLFILSVFLHPAFYVSIHSIQNAHYLNGLLMRIHWASQRYPPKRIFERWKIIK